MRLTQTCNIAANTTFIPKSMAQRQPYEWHSKFKVMTEGFLSLAKVFYSLLTMYFLPEEQPAWTCSSMLPSLSAAQIGSSSSSKPKINSALANFTHHIPSEGTTNYLHTKTCTEPLLVEQAALWYFYKHLPHSIFSVENNKWNISKRIPKCSLQDKTQVHIQPAQCSVCEMGYISWCLSISYQVKHSKSLVRQCWIRSSHAF